MTSLFGRSRTSTLTILSEIRLMSRFDGMSTSMKSNFLLSSSDSKSSPIVFMSL